MVYDDADEEDLYIEQLKPLLVTSRTFELGLGLKHTTQYVRVRAKTHMYFLVFVEATAHQYIVTRERAIALFTHYPVCTIKVHSGRGNHILCSCLPLALALT